MSKEKKKAKGLKITKKAKKNLKDFQKGFNSPGGILRNTAKAVLLACCIWFCCSGYALAQEADGSLKLQWNEVTENADGTPITNLAGYKVYVGEEAGVYTRIETVGTVTETEVDGLEVGKKYFIALTAFNSYNNQSGYSEEVNSPGLYYHIPADCTGVIIIEVTIKVSNP
jgi:hypothetical protein